MPSSFSTSWQVSRITVAPGRSFCTRDDRSPSGGKNHFVFRTTNKFRNVFNGADFFQHFSAASLAPPCAGPHSEAIPVRYRQTGSHPKSQRYARWRWGVLFMVSVQDQNTVHSTFQNGLTSYGSHGVENIIFRKLPGRRDRCAGKQMADQWNTCNTRGHGRHF